LAFQNMNDGGGIQAFGAAQKNGALQQADVRLGVQTVAALRTVRRNKAERFPGA
jgi:hypothetical protein